MFLFWGQVQKAPEKENHATVALLGMGIYSVIMLLLSSLRKVPCHPDAGLSSCFVEGEGEKETRKKKTQKKENINLGQGQGRP